MQVQPLLQLTDAGFYCEGGDFFVDPWRPVRRAIVTHAHGDHLARGCAAYLVAAPGAGLSRLRLGSSARLQEAAYGEVIDLNGVAVSLHPAGHILGSAQVRLQHHGQVWVVSGDYKRAADATCAPFEPLACHTFVTEATFGLPVYRWPDPADVFAEINAWWRSNQASGKASVLFAYALGKAQRILSGLDSSLGPIFTHGAVEQINAVYRQGGIDLPPTRRAVLAEGQDWSQALVIAPPSARATPWLRRFGRQSSGFASGWMRIRGMRRQRAVDRGFILSDHADWPALLDTVRATGAGQVWVTHGYVAVLARWLREQGLDVLAVGTRYVSETPDGETPDAEDWAED